jgi:hypothetical protein
MNIGEKLPYNTRNLQDFISSPTQSCSFDPSILESMETRYNWNGSINSRKFLKANRSIWFAKKEIGALIKSIDSQINPSANYRKSIVFRINRFDSFANCFPCELNRLMHSHSIHFSGESIQWIKLAAIDCQIGRNGVDSRWYGRKRGQRSKALLYTDSLLPISSCFPTKKELRLLKSNFITETFYKSFSTVISVNQM